MSLSRSGRLLPKFRVSHIKSSLTQDLNIRVILDVEVLEVYSVNFRQFFFNYRWKFKNVLFFEVFLSEVHIHNDVLDLLEVELVFELLRRNWLHLDFFRVNGSNLDVFCVQQRAKTHQAANNYLYMLNRLYFITMMRAILVCLFIFFQFYLYLFYDCKVATF